MRALRLIRRVTRLDRMRSANIRRELDVESWSEVVERRQLSWYGHIKRMNDARYPARFYNWQPEGRRPAGRPRRRWRDEVAEAIARRGVTLEEVEERGLYMDRSVCGEASLCPNYAFSDKFLE